MIRVQPFSVRQLMTAACVLLLWGVVTIAPSRLAAQESKSTSSQKPVDRKTPKAESERTVDPAIEHMNKVATVAGLLEELEDYPNAEKYMRQLYEEDPTQILTLAAFLGRHGNLDEAFTLIEKASEDQPLPVVCRVAVKALRADFEKGTDAQKRMTDQWLAAAILETPDVADLKALLIEFRNLEGRFQDSMGIYRRLLARTDLSKHQRATIQNNLAYLLVTRGSRKDLPEAETLIDAAVERFGAIGVVLDTRGLVNLARGDVKAAVADLKVTCADNPSALNYFHLALAEDRAGNVGAAVEAFQKAEELKLDMKLLTPNDLRDHKHLKKEAAKAAKR